MEVYEVLKKNQYSQYLKNVLDGKYSDILLLNLDKLIYAGNLESVEGHTGHVLVQGDIYGKELVAVPFEKCGFDYISRMRSVGI